MEAICLVFQLRAAPRCFRMSCQGAIGRSCVRAAKVGRLQAREEEESLCFTSQPAAVVVELSRAPPPSKRCKPPPSPLLPSPPLAAALRRRLTPIVGLGLLGHTSLRVEARHRGSGGGVRVLQLAHSIAAEVCLNIRARSERLTERCAAGSLCSPCCPVFGAPVHCTRLHPHTLPTCFS